MRNRKADNEENKSALSISIPQELQYIYTVPICNPYLSVVIHAQSSQMKLPPPSTPRPKRAYHFPFLGHPHAPTARLCGLDLPNSQIPEAGRVHDGVGWIELEAVPVGPIGAAALVALPVVDERQVGPLHVRFDAFDLGRLEEGGPVLRRAVPLDSSVYDAEY